MFDEQLRAIFALGQSDQKGHFGLEQIDDLVTFGLSIKAFLEQLIVRAQYGIDYARYVAFVADERGPLVQVVHFDQLGQK